MPVINVKLMEGVFTPDQKEQIIRKFTDAMVSIKGESIRPGTWVILEEARSGDVGIGGNSIRTNDVKAMLAGEAKR